MAQAGHEVTKNSALLAANSSIFRSRMLARHIRVNSSVGTCSAAAHIGVGHLDQLQFRDQGQQEPGGLPAGPGRDDRGHGRWRCLRFPVRRTSSSCERELVDILAPGRKMCRFVAIIGVVLRSLPYSCMMPLQVAQSVSTAPSFSASTVSMFFLASRRACSKSPPLRWGPPQQAT